MFTKQHLDRSGFVALCSIRVSVLNMVLKVQTEYCHIVIYHRIGSDKQVSVHSKMQSPFIILIKILYFTFTTKEKL